MSKWTVRNPYSGEILQEVRPFGDSQLADALKNAGQAFLKWKKTPAWERSRLLTEAAQALEQRREEFALLICKEAGKPLTFARMEVQRAIGVLHWAAAEASRFSGELLRLDAMESGRAGFGIHQRFPRGPVLGITPFNFPLNLVAHKVAPAVACGCSILIKPSPSAPLSAIRFAELFSSVPGLVQVALADDQAAAKLTRAPEIKTLSFTGSARVGWEIRRQAPEKPTTLELGGNAWVVILEDTPRTSFPSIVKKIMQGGFGYAGQSCISVQNVAIAKAIYPELRGLLGKATQALPFGDPEDIAVVAGPVIHDAAARKIQGEIERFHPKFSAGRATFVSHFCSGPRQKGGNLLPPILIELPLSSMPQEEIFGPVVTLAEFSDPDEIINKINSSRYGLQAGVFTRDWPTMEKLYQELEVGGLVINDVPTTRFDHQPYGGVKESGLGREGIRYAMEEMSESKFLALSSGLPL